MKLIYADIYIESEMLKFAKCITIYMAVVHISIALLIPDIQSILLDMYIYKATCLYRRYNTVFAHTIILGKLLSLAKHFITN